MILATFGLQGPKRCSGLPVQRDSPEQLADCLGPHFLLLDRAEELHRTPAGAGQAISYVHARRRS